MAELELEGFEDQPLQPGALFAVVALALVVAVSLVLFVIQATRSSVMATEQRRIDDLQNQIKQFKDVESTALAWSATIPQFNQILQNQIDWGAFWSEIATSQVKGIFYTNASVDNNGTVSLEGNAPSLQTVAKQLKSIGNSGGFKNVKLVASDKSEDRLRFSITFEFNRNYFQVKK